MAAVVEAPGNSMPVERRVVLLGASNLMRGLNTALNTCGRLFPGPIQYLIAAGHGRSYGVTSSFLFCRCLPAIRHCGLWKQLDAPREVPTSALISDIGNDLLHDFRPVEIANWVAECLKRLISRGSDVIISEMPVHSLAQLGPRRFGFIRRVTYPRSRLSYDLARSRIEELHQRILELASASNVPTIRPEPSWFGFDPIHIRWRYYGDAWRKIMTGWNGVRWTRRTVDQSMSRWLRLQCLRPQQRSVFGIDQQRNQPALVDKDGSSISLF